MKSISLLSSFILAALCAASSCGGDTVSETPNEVRATLNGLAITLDGSTGSITRLEYPGVGALLEAPTDRAGMVDLAYPVKDFEPLRLASRYSGGVEIDVQENEITVHWPKLGASRDCFPVEGDVSATVRLRAADDGQSVVMRCEVVNGSKNDVRQILFPDLAGLQPTAGRESTIFRTGGFASRPFLDLAPNDSKESLQYMVDTAAYSAEYQSGGIFNPMWLRWTDLGGLKGGVSLFPRRWGWDPHVPVRLHLSEVDSSLRLLCRHDATIKPGEKWESGEYVLTPHAAGWAKGIEPYRAWVEQHYKREYSVPKHVREGIGYRTVWMCEGQPADPKDAIFTWKDLPELAKESKAHGIDEMVAWGWAQGFVLPLPPPFPHLGTQQEMVDAIEECTKLGVRVAPFISVCQANSEEAPKYGLAVTDNNGWTYHTELVPRWNPPYATGYACVPIPVTNELWIRDVLASCNKLVDQGITCLGWDQYFTTNKDSNLFAITKAIRDYSRERDPESTFCAEELWNMELDSAYLDYTWNWGGYRDCAPSTSVFPAPRVNSCVSSSGLTTKCCFADNLYLNVMPRKKESINGSDLIENQPELSAALKQCAKLKKQFLDYFLDGTFIGNCILSQECAGGHVAAYILKDRALMILVNRGGGQSIEFDCDLGPWISSKSFTVRSFDADGRPVATEQLSSPKWHGKSQVLEPQGMIVYEFTGE